MSAAGNVEFAIKQAHPSLKKRERRELAEDFLAKVGLHDISERYPKELSGGQQQRVAIARALAQDTEVLLMDEPFGAIDAKNRAVLQDLLLKLWEGERGEGDPQSARKTVVFVTHDLEEAILLSDRIILMEANPGRVRAEFQVPLARPRHRLELLKDPAYVEFRSQLSDIFFENEEAEVAAA
jgi:NitT/TauT family transport system ATP-binding protein